MKANDVLPPIPDKILAGWRAGMDELDRAADVWSAGERFQYCLGYLQALEDSLQLPPEDELKFKDQLRASWRKAVERVDQRVTDVVRHSGS